MKSRPSLLGSERGFTLIEVTIAMTLLALMAAILYGAFYLGQKATERVQTSFEDSQKIRTVGDFLGGYIRSAYPYRPSPREQAVVFTGEENRLSFISSISLAMGNRGMSKVSVSWEAQGEEGGSLVLEEEMPVNMGEQSEGAGHRSTVVLWTGVEELRVEYLDPQSEEEHWLERWDGQENKVLPRAIRFDLRREGEEDIRWVFPIMVTVLGL